ncbi:hypothetical protein LPJ53_002775 [Coemansia erecta]|uniref:Transmembrane protein 209 n=1 Tax=Coemansia erecta TaxID=147472 RepID=A0A9W7Y0Q5_9FUNG|nr:hypothetical protein LPJ53_002775 [Coemansia erecta]
MDSYKTPIRVSPGVAIPASVPRPASAPFVTPSSHPRDYRLSASASKASSTLPPSAASLSKSQSPSTGTEDFLRGKWTNPEAQRVLDDRATHPSESQSTMRLRWNVLSLFVLCVLLQTGLYHQIKSVVVATVIPSFLWKLVEYAGLALLACNIGEAGWRLLKPKEQYENTAMTPSQRVRMGLDRNVASTATGTPVVVPRMTPSRAAAKIGTPLPVTSIENRRKTPMKKSATPSVATGSAAPTPQTLRSPVSTSVRITQKEYSTGDDMLTLTQVLKRLPGSGRGSDNLMNVSSMSRVGADLTTASPLVSGGFGGSGMVTPRLPPGRVGLNDIAVLTPMQQHLRPQPTIGLYQTATPARRTSGIDGTRGSGKDRASGGVEYLEPHEVLQKYGVEREILDWVENMHSWFVRHLLRPLCKQIDELDALFEQNGLAHLSCRRAVLDTQALEQAKAAAAAPAPSTLGTFGAGFGSSAFGGMFGGGAGGFGTVAPASSLGQNTQTVPQSLVELSLKYGDFAQTKERLSLEKYLLVSGYSCRDYIIQRVRTLSQSVALPAYTYDGGGRYTVVTDVDGVPTTCEKPWNPTLHPTDAQLLFHLFCTFMDQTMPPAQNVRHPFTDRYVVQSDRKTDYNLPAQIIQVVRKRPHFCLFVKGSFYDVSANRNNLFITLILFVLEIKNECAGYLELTSIGGNHVNLLSVIGN